MEFDPLDGLTIRALNNATSAFVHFHFEVGFFERCSTSSDALNRNRDRNRRRKKKREKRKKKNSGGSSSNARGRRLAGSRTRSRNRSRSRSRRRTLSRGRVSSRVRRKRNRSVSSSSRRRNGEDDEHEYDDHGQHGSYEHNNENGEHDDEEEEGAGKDDHEDNVNKGDEEDDDEDELLADEKYLCKVPIKAISTILRPRKGVTSLRIRSTYSTPANRTAHHHNGHDNRNHTNNQDDDDDDSMSFDEDSDSDEEMGSQMQLSFEYQIQSNGIMRILHKVGVSNAEGIIAIAPKTHCSEIITVPKLLLTMLDQVKSTSEVLLTVNDVVKKVVAGTFDYGDTVRNSVENVNNALLNASSAPSILKTETSIDCHEFEDFHFMDEGAIESVLEDEQKEREKNSNGANTDDSGGGTSTAGGGVGSSLAPLPPEHVSEEVKLVFSIKEARAMLQFCAASQASYLDDEDARVILSFYWGGRPVIIETEGDAFTGELILATVDHSLLNNVSTRFTATATPCANASS